MALKEVLEKLLGLGAEVEVEKMVTCVSCEKQIPFEEAKKNEEDLLEGIERPLYEGPLCNGCVLTLLIRIFLAKQK